MTPGGRFIYKICYNIDRFKPSWRSACNTKYVPALRERADGKVSSEVEQVKQLKQI